MPAPEPQPVAGEGLDPVTLQESGAVAEPDIGQEPLAFDERCIGLSAARGGAVIDDAGSVRRVPVVLDPGDRDVSGARTRVHEVQSLEALHAGVGELHLAPSYVG